MIKLLRAALVAASLFTAPFVALADDDTGPVDPQPVPDDRDRHPHLYGSFCSAKTTDGVWGFVFNRGDLDENCEFVAGALAGATRAPIYASNSGYFLLQGWNEAVATCGPLRSYFYERGALALQRAYEYARIIGGNHCLFEVYFDR